MLSKERPTVLKRAQIGFYLSENKLKDLIQKKKKKKLPSVFRTVLFA